MQALANTLWSFANLRWYPVLLLEPITRAVGRKLAQMSPQEISNSVWSYAKWALKEGGRRPLLVTGLTAPSLPARALPIALRMCLTREALPFAVPPPQEQVCLPPGPRDGAVPGGDRAPRAAVQRAEPDHHAVGHGGAVGEPGLRGRRHGWPHGQASSGHVRLVGPRVCLQLPTCLAVLLASTELCCGLRRHLPPCRPPTARALCGWWTGLWSSSGRAASRQELISSSACSWLGCLLACIGDGTRGAQQISARSHPLWGPRRCASCSPGLVCKVFVAPALPRSACSQS